MNISCESKTSYEVVIAGWKIVEYSRCNRHGTGHGLPVLISDRAPWAPWAEQNSMARFRNSVWEQGMA